MTEQSRNEIDLTTARAYLQEHSIAIGPDDPRSTQEVVIAHMATQSAVEIPEPDQPVGPIVSLRPESSKRLNMF